MKDQIAEAVRSCFRRRPGVLSSGASQRNRVLLWPLSLLLLFVIGEAQAQEESPDLEEVVVTGTATGTGIRGVAPVGVQTLSMDRVELKQSPVREPAEIISMLPQGSQIGTGVASADGGNNSGNAGINLRGLGGKATLMLLDGHRMVGQGVSEIRADPSMIPFAAIQGVEVVLGGASAVYGSDAVAGVVNFILRDEFEGLDLNASREIGLYDTTRVELVAGRNWDDVNVLFGLSYKDQSDMERSELGYLSEDLRPYGGADNRRSGRRPTPANAALIEVNQTFYGVPENFAGVMDPSTGLVRPTLAEVLATEPVFGDAADYENYIGAAERKGAFAKVTFDVSDTLRLAYTGLISQRDSHNITLGILPLVISPDSPYYLPGLNPSGGSYSMYVNTAERGFTWHSRPWGETQNHYLDLRKDIGAWQMNASFVYGKTEGQDIHRPERNNAALIDDPAGTPDGYRNYADYGNNPEWFNPYLTTPQGMAEHLIGMTFRRGYQHLRALKVRFEGPVADLPGGTMRLNVGARAADSDSWVGLDQTVRYYDKRNYWLRDTSIDRQVRSVFAEVYMPLVRDLPAVQQLALNLSVRTDEYSDFGSTTNPRLGLTWDINDSLSIHGSMGSAFRAPSLTQINSGANSTLTRSTISVVPGLGVPITNPAFGTADIFTRGGRSPDLGPETADMWSIGFDYTPIQLEGLTVHLTYYDVQYEDRIEELPNWETALSSARTFRLYAPYIYPYTQPTGCVDGQLNTYTPVLTQWLEVEGTRFAGGPGDCNTVALIDRGLQNVGSVHQNGIDFRTTYNWSTDFGSWQASANIAKILELKRTLIAGGQWFDVLDRIGWQTSLRATSRLSWLQGNWAAALTARIEGGYTNDQTPLVNGVQLPDQEVGSWTTWDATASFNIPEGGDTFWSGASATLAIQNLTDKQPPIVLNGSDAIDAAVHNPFGRLVRIGFSKRF